MEEATSAITPDREEVLKKLLNAVYSKSKKAGAKLTFAADVKMEADEVKYNKNKICLFLICIFLIRCQVPR